MSDRIAVTVRFGPADLRQIDRAAEREHRRRSDWIRVVALRAAEKSPSPDGPGRGEVDSGEDEAPGSDIEQTTTA